MNGMGSGFAAGTIAPIVAAQAAATGSRTPPCGAGFV